MFVRLTPDAAKAVDGLPRVIRARVTDFGELSRVAIFARLEHWPAVSGAKPLTGNMAGRYRIRTGDYRIQFHLAGDAVVVERIGHRDGFYED